MIYIVADKIKTYISSLSFIDDLFGLTQPMQFPVKSATGTGVSIKTFPTEYRTPTSCDSGHNAKIAPDSSKKSVIWFEDQGFTSVNNTADWIDYEGTLRMVVWLNYKKIDQSMSNYTAILSEILTAIPVNMGNSQPLAGIRIGARTHVRDADIFGEYSFIEPEKQFLIYPYDYFALDLAVRYRFMLNCERTILDPSSC